MNIAAGLGGASLVDFLAASIIGMAPATVIYSGVGAGLGRVLAHGGRLELASFAEPQILAPLFGLAALSLTPVVAQYIRGKSADSRHG